MAKVSMLANTGVRATAERIKAIVPQLGRTVDLNDELKHMQGDAGAHLMVFEKYYWRNESYTSLSVSVTGDSQSAYVDIIGAGGGGGLFNISFGSEEEFVENLAEALEAQGCRRISEE